VYSDYLKAKHGLIQGPFKPKMVVVPRILSANWVNDNDEILMGVLDVYLWQGRQVDMGTAIVNKNKILDMSDTEIAA
jgi:hypothetical protein